MVKKLNKLHNLNDADTSKIAKEIFESMKDGGDMYNHYLNVLIKNDIMCPHPQHKRLYIGHIRSKYEIKNHKWYECEMCNCVVINE